MFPAHPRTFVAFRVCEVDEQVSAWILDICGCLHDVGGISMLFSRQRVENAQIPRQTRCVTPLVIKADGTCHSIFFGGGSILTRTWRGKPKGSENGTAANPLTV